MTSSETRLRRRDFLQKSAAGAALARLAAVPRHVLGGAGHTPPSEKVNLACIGVGNRGWQLVQGMQHHNIVALCDVDEKYLGKASERYPGARKYNDFRKLLDWEENNVDAVVVATPDHVHVPATVMALKMGKHCYTEKPLGHNVYEVREATRVARRYGLATQLGNTWHSAHIFRSVVELIRGGTIGEVKEVHAWCDNEWEAPPRVAAGDGSRRGRDRPKETPPVPAYLDWDLWLGPAPYRPYHPCYHPVQWRSWWDFGNGRLGDMGCHLIDLPFTALDLRHPLTVEADGPPAHPESAPPWLISKWTFPARGDQPPVELTWYDGNKRPELLKEVAPPDSNYPWYVLLVGAEGMLIAGMDTFRLYPEEKFAGLRRPRLPQGPSHADQWLAACKTGTPAGTHFGYSGPLTETVLLGTVAYRAGQKLEWDAENLRVTNCPEAQRFIRRATRQGWTL
jgi:predicted dehydrogenase